MFAYSQYYDTKKSILLYPKYNLDIANKTLSKTDNNEQSFSLQISTLDLHLDKDSGYRDYVSGLKGKVKSIMGLDTMTKS